MKKTLSVILCLVMLLGAIPVSAFAETPATRWTDSGNYDISWYSDDKTLYEISTAQQLAGVAALIRTLKIDFDGKTISVISDIDLADYEWVPIGHSKHADNIPGFKGTFCGNGNKIKNMTVSIESDHVYSGLFGNTDRCVIRDVTVQGNVAGKMYAAILCATGEPKVINCRTEGTVSSHSHAAGILSYSSDGTSLINCMNYADICSKGYYAAGILGSGGNYLLNCSNFGKITSDFECGLAAGIAACASGPSTVKNCFNSGSILLNAANDSGACGAGIAADASYATISNCVNVAPMPNFKYHGSISINEHNNSKIENCFALEGTVAAAQPGLSVNVFTDEQTAEVTQKLNAWIASQPDSSLLAIWNLTEHKYPVPELFCIKTAVDGIGGAVSPSENGAAYCKMGESLCLTAVANQGYHSTNTAVVDGKAVTLDNNSYTFTNVYESHSFDAEFEKCSYAETFREEAACKQDGYADYSCTVCGGTYRQLLKAPGHIDADKDGVCDVCSQAVNSTSAKLERIMNLIFMILDLVFAFVLAVTA